MARRRSWRGLLGLLVLVAVAGHVYFWYWPRERPAKPLAGDPTAALVLTPQDLPLCVWVPYPHQNLAGLSREDSRLSTVATALQILRGDPGRPVPTFGPFSLPPAYGLGLCTDRAGERLTLVAEVFPLLARVARWSGQLAGNPWLAGGSVERGERRLEVRWDGNIWSVGDRAFAEPGAGLEDHTGSVLGLVRLGEAWGPVPAGLFRVERNGPDLSFRSTGLARIAELGALAEMEPVGNGIPLVAVAVEDGPEPDVRALAMVAGAGLEERRLPGFATLHRGPGERWRLPREALGALLDEAAVESEVGGWVVAAWEPADLALAAAIVPELGPVEALAGKGLEFALWVEPGRVGPVLHGLADDLERIPLVKRRYVRAWRAAAVAAGALSDARLLTLTVLGGDTGPDLEILLSERVAPATMPD